MTCNSNLLYILWLLLPNYASVLISNDAPESKLPSGPACTAAISLPTSACICSSHCSHNNLFQVNIWSCLLLYLKPCNQLPNAWENPLKILNLSPTHLPTSPCPGLFLLCFIYLLQVRDLISVPPPSRTPLTIRSLNLLPWPHPLVNSCLLFRSWSWGHFFREGILDSLNQIPWPQALTAPQTSLQPSSCPPFAWLRSLW